MKYGLLKYSENKKTFNIGDYIQSLAAKQFLPRVDMLINREKLAKYNNEKTKIILNGWFTHNIHNWIPSDSIIPLFISFHINNTAAPFILSKEGISYLKKHEPIGCRDHYTMETLIERGVKAYFSGCLTLTLDKYKVKDSERSDDIYIVDPLYGYNTSKKIFYNYKSIIRNIINGNIFHLKRKEKHLRKTIDDDLLKKAKFIKHELPAGKYIHTEKFEIAEDLLHKYAKAKLVITSRIHCALPCLAMGTPVIFINGFDNFVDSCRFDGILELFNRIDINEKTGEWTANFSLKGKINENTMVNNLNMHIKLASAMKKKCNIFIEKKID